MGLIKEALAWVWNTTPWYVKGYFALVVIPNLAIIIFIFIAWFIPWNNSNIKATILTYEEKRDAQIMHLQERQLLVDKITADNVVRIEQHLSIVQGVLMSRQPAER